MTDAAEKFWALRFAKRPGMRKRSMLLRMSCPGSRATTSSVWRPMMLRLMALSPMTNRTAEFHTPGSRAQLGRRRMRV